MSTSRSATEQRSKFSDNSPAHLTLLLADGEGRGWVCGVATGREVEMTQNSEHLLTLGAHAQRGFLCVCVCVCVCVCQCVQAAHLRLTQLSDKLDILTDLVSWWLQN